MKIKDILTSEGCLTTLFAVVGLTIIGIAMSIIFYQFGVTFNQVKVVGLYALALVLAVVGIFVLQNCGDIARAVRDSIREINR